MLHWRTTVEADILFIFYALDHSKIIISCIFRLTTIRAFNHLFIQSLKLMFDSEKNQFEILNFPEDVWLRKNSKSYHEAD